MTCQNKFLPFLCLIGLVTSSCAEPWRQTEAQIEVLPISSELPKLGVNKSHECETLIDLNKVYVRIGNSVPVGTPDSIVEERARLSQIENQLSALILNPDSQRILRRAVDLQRSSREQKTATDLDSEWILSKDTPAYHQVEGLSSLLGFAIQGAESAVQNRILAFGNNFVIKCTGLYEGVGL